MAQSRRRRRAAKRGSGLREAALPATAVQAHPADGYAGRLSYYAPLAADRRRECEESGPARKRVKNSGECASFCAADDINGACSRAPLGRSVLTTTAVPNMAGCRSGLNCKVAQGAVKGGGDNISNIKGGSQIFLLILNITTNI